MIETSPDQNLDYYCEAIERGLFNQEWTEEVRVKALEGLTEGLMALKSEASLRDVFDRRVSGIAKLIPKTEAFAGVVAALKLETV